MSELKPCPKCWQPVRGKVTGGLAAFGCGEYSYDVDCKCGISFSTVCCFETPEEAEEYGIGQWNTSAERTCGEPRGFIPYDQDNFGHPSFTELWCEHCDIELDPEWEYCPNCGAKVVGS